MAYELIYVQRDIDEICEAIENKDPNHIFLPERNINTIVGFIAGKMLIDYDYQNPVYTWSNNGSSCIAEMISNLSTDCNKRESGTIQTSILKNPTCVENGITRYTANFVDPSFTSQNLDLLNIPAKGHSYQTATSTLNNGIKTPASCTEPAIYYQKCSRCSIIDLSKYNFSGGALGHDKIDDRGCCSRCGAKIVDTQSITWSEPLASNTGKFKKNIYYIAPDGTERKADLYNPGEIIIKKGTPFKFVTYIPATFHNYSYGNSPLAYNINFITDTSSLLSFNKHINISPYPEEDTFPYYEDGMRYFMPGTVVLDCVMQNNINGICIARNTESDYVYNQFTVNNIIFINCNIKWTFTIEKVLH